MIPNTGIAISLQNRSKFLVQKKAIWVNLSRNEIQKNVGQLVDLIVS